MASERIYGIIINNLTDNNEHFDANTTNSVIAEEFASIGENMNGQNPPQIIKTRIDLTSLAQDAKAPMPAKEPVQSSRQIIMSLVREADETVENTFAPMSATMPRGTRNSRLFFEKIAERSSKRRKKIKKSQVDFTNEPESALPPECQKKYYSSGVREE